MPNLGRRLALSLALAASAADAQGQEVVVARATTSELSPNLVRTVARDFESTRLEGALLADANGKTPFELIEALCGSVNPTYYGEFQAANGAKIDPRATLTTQSAEALVFPACLRVTPLPAGTVGRIASQSTAAQAITDPSAVLVGIGPVQNTVGANPFARFIMGRKATFQTRGFVVTPVELVPRHASPELAAKLLREDPTLSLGVVGTPAAGSILTDTQTEMRGQIVEQADAGSIDPNSAHSKACPSKSQAFNAKLVASAYEWSTKRRQAVLGTAGAAAIYVVDNGFFGANPAAHTIFSAAFPKELFPWREESGRVGPLTPYGESDIYPSNYINGFDPTARPSNEAAHGTHVAGLTIGGPEFLTPLSTLLLKTDSGPRVGLTIINVGKGARYLIRNSHLQIPTLLDQIPQGYARPKARIVNMSVVYEGPQAKGILTGMFLERPDTLFVVAAGNSQKPVGPGQVYPAALGGLARQNVISVAAHDASENPGLAWFTNYGSTVDIAAPGCGINSWFDGTREDALTGTSQAAPVVTFASALLTSLDGSLSPWQVKARILVSGDLLGGGEVRWNVASGSRIDVVRSLFLYDDVVVVWVVDPQDPTKKIQETWVGDVRQIFGFRCAGSPAAFVAGYDRDTFWAFKTSGSDAELFIDRNAASINHCKAALSAPATDNPLPFVKFVRRGKIVGDEVRPDAGPIGGELIEIGRISALVLKGPNKDSP